MPGAWEIRDQQSVLCYTIHTDTTTVAWAYGLRNLIVPGPVLGVAGMPYDHARNVACQQCLQGGFEWIFSLDSDVIVPRDAVLRLLAHKQPFISALYCRRSPPHGVPVMIKDGQWVTQFRDGALVEVDLVGAGALLMHRSILERLPPQRPGKPWFDWRVDMQGIKGPDGALLYQPGECLSEDFTLCQAVRRYLGVKVLVDTSIKCRHVGYSQAVFGGFEPLDCTPVT